MTAGVSVYCKYTWCARKPQQGTRSVGIGATDS